MRMFLTKPADVRTLYCCDTTLEGLVPILLQNPRGVLLTRDELVGWIGSFDKYSKGSASADVAHWLSLYNAESITVDRKTGNRPRYLYLTRRSPFAVRFSQGY